MAEHDLKITVSADTTDAKKKIEGVGKVKVKPIKVAVEADEVKIDAPNVKPVKVPVEADTEKAKRKIKDLGRTKVDKIRVESEIGETGISKGLGALKSLRTSVNGVMNALGAIGFFVGIGTAVAGVVMRIKEAFEATGKAIAGMRFKDYVNDITSGTERMLSAQGKLNKLLQDEQDTIRKTREIRDAETKGNDTAEDSVRANDRSIALSKERDPRAKKRLENQFAAEDEEINEARRKRDSRQREKDLDEDASVYSSKSEGAKAKAEEIKEQIKAQEELANRVKLNKAGKLDREERGWWEAGGMFTPKALADVRNRVNQRKAMDDPEVKAAYDKLSELRKAYDEMIKSSEEYAEEAGRLSKMSDIERKSREKIDAGKSGKSAAQEKDKEENAFLEKEDRKSLEKHRERMSKTDTDERWLREMSGTDDQGKASMLMVRENMAKSRLEKAEEDLASEMEKEASERDSVKISELMSKAEQAQSDMFGFRSQREAIEKSSREKQISDLESSAARAQSVDAVSQNRLTAMGLGSGVSAKGGVQTDIRRIVDLLRQNVEATKNIKPVEIDTTATFTE